MKELDKIQSDISVWRSKNFGMESKSFVNLATMLEDPNNAMMITQVMGASEEVGELSHAVLKRMQGIRGMDDFDEFRKEAVDAVGDIIIYLMGFCDTICYNMSDIVEKVSEDVLEREWNNNKKNGQQKLKPLNLEKDPKIERLSEEFTNIMKVEQVFQNSKHSFDQLMVFVVVSSALKLMLGDRNDTYNKGGIEIKDYWDNLTESFQMVKVKFLRAKASTAKHDGEPSAKAIMELADSIIDIVNYGGFHLANAIRSTNMEGVVTQILSKYDSHQILLTLLKGVSDE